jgi:transposase
MAGRYDLKDEEYALIEPLLPPERTGKPGCPPKPHRQMLNGILWVLRTGAPWRDVPERYGPWSTVYDRFRHWRDEGLWQRLVDALQARARKYDRFDFEFGAFDGTVVRAHKSAAGAKKGASRPKKAENGRV